MASDDASPARRLRDALEPIATLSFHSEPAQRAYAEIGFTEFAHRYFWSRSSPLGVVDASVVAATFGVWEPAFVRAGLEAGQSRCDRGVIRRATDTGSGSAVRAVLAGVAESEILELVGVLRRGIDAADVTARPLFAANRALPHADDVHTALWRAATAWRELRGDSHLVVCAADGVDGLTANILNELDAGYELGEYTATRNWSDAEIAGAAADLRDRGLLDGSVLSDAGRLLRDELERATDLGVQSAVAALGDDLDAVVERADAWSQWIVDRGWFPDDTRKRAAG